MTRERELRPLSKARRAMIADLATRAGRERRGRFMLEGTRAIEDALDRGLALDCLVSNADGERDVARWVAAGLVPEATALYRVEREELERLADTATPQGVLAVGALPPAGLDALPDPGAAGRGAAPGGAAAPPLLLVDGVQDPGNLGTLLRTLAAVGGRIAICCTGTVDPFNPKALRGSAGTALGLGIARGIERATAIGWCAEREIPIVALAAGGSDLFASRATSAIPAGPVALAIGNEAGGLSAEIERAAAVVAGIPMEPGVESLSAAVAGSVALYALAHHLVRA